MKLKRATTEIVVKAINRQGGQKPPKRSSAEEVEPDWLDFSAEYELGVGMMGLSHNEFWDLTPAEF